MPEHQRGRDPNRQPRKEVPLPEYREARRYPDEPTSNTAYEQTRQVIYEEPCDLSLYRTALLPEVSWHVLILGGMPEERVRERVHQSLQSGEAIELPDDVWRQFNQRRLEQTASGPWVERRVSRRRLR